MEPYNERFQELVEDILETIKTLEFEIVAYHSAFQKLQNSFEFDRDIASFFQSALLAAYHSQKIRKDLEVAKRERIAQFQQMPNVPIGPKMDALRVFLSSFRSGDSRFFPLNDSPLKDAK